MDRRERERSDPEITHRSKRNNKTRWINASRDLLKDKRNRFTTVTFLWVRGSWIMFYNPAHTFLTCEDKKGFFPFFCLYAFDSLNVCVWNKERDGDCVLCVQDW